EGVHDHGRSDRNQCRYFFSAPECRHQRAGHAGRIAGHRSGRHRRHVAVGWFRHRAGCDARRAPDAVAAIRHGPARHRLATSEHCRRRRADHRRLARYSLQEAHLGRNVMADIKDPVDRSGTPLVEMKNISIAFGGIRAVDDASLDLYPGEVVALLGHNGAGKSTFIKILSGAYKRDAGQIFVNGEEVQINNPRDAKKYGIETIYQTLALADNVDAAANLFLGRELMTPWNTLDDVAMEA